MLVVFRSCTRTFPGVETRVLILVALVLLYRILTSHYFISLNSESLSVVVAIQTYTVRQFKPKFRKLIASSVLRICRPLLLSFVSIDWLSSIVFIVSYFVHPFSLIPVCSFLSPSSWIALSLFVLAIIRFFS